MFKTKIALSMIVKDDTEVNSLKRCLDSVAPYVDGIYLTATQKPHDKLQELANQYGANIDVRPGEFNYQIPKKEVKWLQKFLGWTPTMKEGDVIFKFAEARNSNINFIPDDYDWLFWMDADDVLLGADKLKIIADNAMNGGWESVFMNYIYQAEIDPEGRIKNIVIQHSRERLVRIKGEYRKVYKWIGNIHETLIQQRETKKTDTPDLEVLHLSTNDRFVSAISRNMRVLEHEIYETKGKDPRPIYYLGKALFDHHTPEAQNRAIKLILMYLSPENHESNMSGWKEERAQAWEYLGEIYRELRQYNNSIKALMNSLIEYPQLTSVYMSLAVTCMMREDFDSARFWAIFGSRIPISQSTLVSNPRDIASRKYEVIYNSGLKTNRIDEAWAACQKLKEMYPDDATIDEQWRFINETREIRDQLKNFADMSNYLAKTGQSEKLRALVSSAPSQLYGNPYYENIKHDLFPPKDWTDKEIALYCGPQFTAWDATSVENTTSFVGGSEEAVIYMAKELAKLGWRPVVYADPLKEGIYDGVEYLSHYKFNPRDNFNILIYWRAVSWVDMNCNAKQTYLWAHDVLNPVEFSEERVKKFTKIFVLSQAHRENLPDVPDDKIVISSNGFYEHLPELKADNDPKKVIYTSSYDRGLENLLEIWSEVKKEVPDAELHVFYGWLLFKHFYKGNPERMSWMRKMEELLKQPGVTEHGRVSQPEMEKWMKSCGIWAYPSHFYEINCISGIKAQAYGSVPVVTDYAALKQTVQYGKKVEGEVYDNFGLSPELKKSFTEELIKALKDGDWQKDQREKMTLPVREKYSWEKIAKDWTYEFKKGLEQN